ncbi:MAG TPA: hypothetical protein VHZ50_08955, partial [Puia sp.]|nr:hypothetical protein [Puia sp.]
MTDYILTSDHRCINFKMNLDPLPPLLFRNPASTNWPLFTDLIEKELSNIKCDQIPQNRSEVDILADTIQLLLA